MLKTSFKTTFKSLFPILRREVPFLIFLTLITAVLTDHFASLGAYRGESMEALAPKLALLTVDLTKSLLLALLIPYRLFERLKGLAPTSFWKILNVHSVPLTIESMRALSVVLLWALALILPGIYKLIRLSFMPMVVLTDPQYASGKVDPLKRSEEICRGFTIWIIAITVVFWVMDAAVTTLQHDMRLTAQPSEALGLAALSMILNVIYYLWLMSFYWQRTQGEK